MTMVPEDRAITRLPHLIDLALQGEQVIITREERAVMQLVPVATNATAHAPRARFGSGKGTLVYMAPDFNAPLDDFREYME